MNEPATERELVITRLFDAPRELVYRCWTEPEHLMRWWGPAGFRGASVTVHPVEGGAWRFGMRNAEGEEHWASGVYLEAVPPRRLVFSFRWDPEEDRPVEDTLITVTLADKDGKTEMTFHQSGFATGDSRDGHDEGWRETFDALAQHLADNGKENTVNTVTLPDVVSAEEWQVARDALLVKEKAAMRAQDKVNAERRRLPMVEFPNDYPFTGPEGPKSLLELFDGRRQLIIYHHMLFAGDDHRCEGCALVTDNIAPVEHLHARDTTLVVTAPAPLSEIEAYRERMGWTVPWYSGTQRFADDCGSGQAFGISVFLRDGDRVYRTYFTTGRGGEFVVSTLRWLDLTPFGRQEAWEESGRGNSEPGSWWRLHDEYV